MKNNYCVDCGAKNIAKESYCIGCGKKIAVKRRNYWWLVSAFILLTFVAWLFSDDSEIYDVFEESGYELIMKSFIDDSSGSVGEGVSASVVNVLCPYAGEPMSFDADGSGGSGVVMYEEGIVLTNSHVIPQDEDYLNVNEEGCIVIFPDETTGLPREAYLAEPNVYEGISDEYDLAWLEIYDVYVGGDGTSYGVFPNVFPSADQIECGDETVKLGEKLIIYGYPQATGGYSLTITEGVVSAFNIDGIVTSAKIDHGNSGGLATDEKGCFVGIPTAVNLGEAESYGIIISVGDILDFFEEVNNLPEEDI